MLLDTFDRPLGNLRLSVTDRCNLRCEYCMPEKDYVWLPREDLLHFEEISALVDIFISLGVNRIRLTGGEPLLRRDLASLVEMLSGKAGLVDLALTTNGVLLEEQVDALSAAGLGRVTVSLDTLRHDRFVALARVDELDRVKAGIQAAHRVFSATIEGDRASSESASPAQAGSVSSRLKIDTVVIKDVNADELTDLVEYGKTVNAEVRFIEYMDVGGATKWAPARVFSRHDILDVLGRRYGRIEPVVEQSSAPADRFALADGTTFGIISSTTDPFCRNCDRSRLTADGLWYLCLYAAKGTDIRAAIRRGADADELRALLSSAWRQRDDRGAETRLALGERRAFVPINALRQDPHLEMHTRGG